MLKASPTANRFTLLSVAALLTVGSLLVVFLNELRQWDTMATRLTRQSLEATLDGIFHSALTRATGEAVSFAATGNQDYAREATEALLYAQSAMTQLRRIGTTREASGGNGRIMELRRAQDDLLSRVRRSVTQALRLAPAAEPKSRERLEQLYAPETDSDRTWLAVVAWHDNERRLLNHELRGQRHHVLALGAGTLIAGLLWALIMHSLVVREFISPLRELAQRAQHLADGEDDAALAVTAGGDLGALQDAFNRIAQRLQAQEAQVAPPPGGDVEDETALPAAGVAPAAGAPAQRRALLMASDPAERDLARAMLQHCGMQVTLAEDAAQAADRLRQGEFEVLVVDLAAADAQAIATIAKDRGRGGAKRIPMIVLGAPDTDGTAPTWQLADFDQYLKRPYSYFDLHAALSRHFPGS